MIILSQFTVYSFLNSYVNTMHKMFMCWFCNKAKRALRALRGLARLKSLIDGHSVKRQATTTLRYMQMLARIQSQIRTRRIRMLEENQALQRQMLLKHERELEILKVKFGIWYNILVTLFTIKPLWENAFRCEILFSSLIFEVYLVFSNFIFQLNHGDLIDKLKKSIPNI